VVKTRVTDLTGDMKPWVSRESTCMTSVTRKLHTGSYICPGSKRPMGKYMDEQSVYDQQQVQRVETAPGSELCWLREWGRSEGFPVVEMTQIVI
jgi:hypothetical protein